MTGAIYESALKAWPRFRHQGRPVLAWLFTIAGRRVADFYRRRPPTPGLPGFEVVDSTSPGPAEAAERSLDLAALHEALERLGAADREIIDLHFFAGLSHGEAAGVLGITINAATVRLHRALKRLGKELELHVQVRD